MTCHEAIDVMGEALEGHLDVALLPGFDAHLAECRPCATYFEHLQVVRRALLELPGEPSMSPHRSELLAEYRRRFRTGVKRRLP